MEWNVENYFELSKALTDLAHSFDAHYVQVMTRTTQKCVESHGPFTREKAEEFMKNLPINKNDYYISVINGHQNECIIQY